MALTDGPSEIWMISRGDDEESISTILMRGNERSGFIVQTSEEMCFFVYGEKQYQFKREHLIF